MATKGGQGDLHFPLQEIHQVLDCPRDSHQLEVDPLHQISHPQGGIVPSHPLQLDLVKSQGSFRHHSAGEKRTPLLIFPRGKVCRQEKWQTVSIARYQIF